MNPLKILCGFVCLLVLISNIWSISRWSEARGVYDDICYLRQAHLFQRFGLKGLDTDISRDDDGYMASKMREIGMPADSRKAPCHTSMPASGKFVIQYPPGTGFVLALFPDGHQVIALYAAATIVVFGFAVLGIYMTGSTASTLLAGAFGCLALYLMINPAKASYSVVPTMVVCVLGGFLTAHLFLKTSPRHRMFLTVLTGLLLGLGANFRLPNLFLSGGYFLFFGFELLRVRKLQAFLQGALFAAAYLVGIAPMLIANAINAGSPFTTTYGADPNDLGPRGIHIDVLWSYAKDLQFLLLIIAGSWIAWILRLYGGAGIRSVAFVATLNLAVNLAFFMTHPAFNPYYMMPILMLSLWSLLFASLMQPAEAAEGRLTEQTAKA